MTCTNGAPVGAQAPRTITASSRAACSVERLRRGQARVTSPAPTLQRRPRREPRRAPPAPGGPARAPPHGHGRACAPPAALSSQAGSAAIHLVDEGELRPGPEFSSAAGATRRPWGGPIPAIATCPALRRTFGEVEPGARRLEGYGEVRAHRNRRRSPGRCRGRGRSARRPPQPRNPRRPGSRQSVSATSASGCAVQRPRETGAEQRIDDDRDHSRRGPGSRPTCSGRISAAGPAEACRMIDRRVMPVSLVSSPAKPDIHMPAALLQDPRDRRTRRRRCCPGPQRTAGRGARPLSKLRAPVLDHAPRATRASRALHQLGPGLAAPHGDRPRVRPDLGHGQDIAHACPLPKIAHNFMQTA